MRAATSEFGTKPKWWNVRFCAAVGGQADIKASSGSADFMSEVAAS